MRGGNVVSLTIDEKNKIFEIYNEAKKLSFLTKIPHHVDHIRPLAAGGTHHPENLRVIPATENLSKGSHYNGIRKSYSAKDKKILREKFVQEQNFKKELLKEQSRRKISDANKKSNYLILLVMVLFVMFFFIIK